MIISQTIAPSAAQPATSRTLPNALSTNRKRVMKGLSDAPARVPFGRTRFKAQISGNAEALVKNTSAVAATNPLMFKSVLGCIEFMLKSSVKMLHLLLARLWHGCDFPQHAMKLLRISGKRIYPKLSIVSPPMIVIHLTPLSVRLFPFPHDLPCGVIYFLDDLCRSRFVRGRCRRRFKRGAVIFRVLVDTTTTAAGSATKTNRPKPRIQRAF